MSQILITSTIIGCHLWHLVATLLRIQRKGRGLSILSVSWIVSLAYRRIVRWAADHYKSGSKQWIRTTCRSIFNISVSDQVHLHTSNCLKRREFLLLRSFEANAPRYLLIKINFSKTAIMVTYDASNTVEIRFSKIR